MSTIKTNDINTYYETHGKGKPLVLIHGAGFTHEMWQPQVKYFSKRYRVVIYDIRGHGQSEGSDRDYTCGLFADDLAALLDSLRLRKSYICGLSLGGMIAQEYAVKYPDKVSGLVLADTAASSALTLSDKIQKYLFPKFLVKLLIRTLSPERYADFSLWFFRDMKTEAKEYIRREQIEFKRKELLKVVDAIYDFNLLDLSRITAPTLIIAGEKERKAVFTHADKMKELIPNSQIAIIHDAMHASNLENPDEFNRVLEDFLYECGQ